MGMANKGSRKHLQGYVNKRSEALSGAILSASPLLTEVSTGTITWVSPLEDEGYKEYKDASFLKRIGLGQHTAALKCFWPRGGATWDALAKIKVGNEDGALLVEAKSHLRESPRNDVCRASSRSSIDLIASSLLEARGFYGVPSNAPSWSTAHYQVCNRLAHLYLMNEVLHVPTWLVWLFIENDPDWKDGTSSDGWHSYIQSIYTEIGLPSKHPLEEKIVFVCLPPFPSGNREEESATT